MLLRQLQNIVQNLLLGYGIMIEELPIISSEQREKLNQTIDGGPSADLSYTFSQSLTILQFIDLLPFFHQIL